MCPGGWDKVISHFEKQKRLSKIDDWLSQNTTKILINAGFDNTYRAVTYRAVFAIPIDDNENEKVSYSVVKTRKSSWKRLTSSSTVEVQRYLPRFTVKL